MTFSIPKVRAYYPARNGSNRILCWLPEDELKALIQRGDAPGDIIEDFPSGLEIEVSQDSLDEYEIRLGYSPESICTAYQYFKNRDSIDISGLVDGASLERILKQALSTAAGNSLEDKLEMVVARGTIIPKPDMSVGTDPSLGTDSFRE